MLLLRLWNYIRGYVIIIVEGYFLEKFINICIHRQILLWDVKKQNNCRMILKVSIDGFKMLRPIARKTKCRIAIAKKKGLPFTMHRYKSRKTFVAGAFVFIVLIYLLTSFVWTVEVIGNKNISSQDMVDKLAEHGVKPGILKYKINTNKVVDNLMMDIKEIAWVGVVLKGTKLKIEVVERIAPPELVPKNIPCNIVAKRDGVIKTIVAKDGEDVVKAGATVTKGQLLISGVIKNKNDEKKTRLVHAIGIVKARTWYESSKDVITRVMQKERTGLTKDNLSFLIFAKRFDLFHRKVPYENFEKVEIKKCLSLGEDFIFPFGVIIDRYYEENIVENEINLDDAKKAAADDAYKEASQGISQDAEIIKSNINFLIQKDGRLTANVTIECLEDIGATQEIGGK